jgi:DNA-binding PadR family transcriptional regulator
MQNLRGAGWVKASALPSSPVILSSMLEKGWIEQRGEGRDLCYRITDHGLAAKTRQIPV